jgi:hypothetical protein
MFFHHIYENTHFARTPTSEKYSQLYTSYSQNLFQYYTPLHASLFNGISYLYLPSTILYESIISQYVVHV